MIEHLCKKCGKAFYRYSSLQTKCGLCTANKLVAKKPMKKIGKVTKAWLDERNQWIKDNPPNHQGFYFCELRRPGVCLYSMTVDQLTLDHVKSRSRRPDLRTEASNLVPACLPCNRDKGSGE